MIGEPGGALVEVTTRTFQSRIGRKKEDFNPAGQDSRQVWQRNLS
jgi:hypothetical protein